MATIDEVKKYYADLLILQYRNKPKARKTIQTGVDIYSGDGVLFQVPDILNIDVAEGAQLDIIGKILGCPRDIPGINTQTKYFTFHVDEDSLGFSTVGNPSFGTLKNRSNSVLATYTLSDDEYRPLLKFKAFLNVWRGDMASMDRALYQIFRYDVYLTNNQDLSISYEIANNTVTVQAARALGYFKAPIGINTVFEENVWSPIIKTENSTTAIAYGNSTYVKANNYDVSVSKNGIDYETVLTRIPKATSGVTNKTAITFGNNRFIIAGSDGLIISYDNGITWSEAEMQTSSYNWRGIRFINNVFNAVGLNYRAYSTNGTDWSFNYLQYERTPSYWEDITFNNELYIICGNYHNSSIYKGCFAISYDGTNWSIQPRFRHELHSIDYGALNVVAVGNDGYMYYSSDGVNRTEIQVGTNNWNKIRYIDNKFIAVGDYGYISTSSDGINWETPYQLGNSSWRDITSDNEKIWIVGDGGMAFKYFDTPLST